MKSEKSYLFLLVFIILLGLVLRVGNFKDQLIFAYDQARDAFRIQEIIKNKDIKIVGPETDIPGVFHGPLFYYLITLPYAVSQGDPNLPVFFMILINIAGVPLIYYCSYSLIQDKKTAILSALFFAISFEMANYARYLSNVSPLPISTLIFYLGLWLWIKEEKLGLPLSALGWGLSVQFNFLYIYLLFFYPLCYWLFRPKTPKDSLVHTLILTLFFFSTFFVAEVKFQFASLSSLVNFILNQGKQAPSPMDALRLYTEQLMKTFRYNLFYWCTPGIFCLFITAFLFIFNDCWKKITKDKPLLFLLLWVFSTVPLFTFSSGVHHAPQINAALPAAFFILFANFLSFFLKKKQLLPFTIILLLILTSNLFLFLKNNLKPVSLFLIEKGVIFHNEQRVLDYIYQKSEKRPFSICAVTAPLFVDTTWSYLFEDYGQKEYGFLPYWAGFRDHVSLGHLPQDDLYPETRFLIIEGSGIIPEQAIRLYRLHEETISKKLEIRSFEGITVEYRKLLTPQEREKRKQESLKENKHEWLILKEDPRYSCFF